MAISLVLSLIFILVRLYSTVKANIEEIIVVCPNCYYFLGDKLDVKIVTIYEKLKELNLGKIINEENLPIYYPCPDREDKLFFNTIKPFIKGEIKNSF